jgi:hypothetical protein
METKLNSFELIKYQKIEQAILSELNNWDLSCSEEFALKCQLATALTNSIINTAGVRFAEAELQKPKTFEIDFCGQVKAKIEVTSDKLTIIAAMDGYGDVLDPDQIIITPTAP